MEQYPDLGSLSLFVKVVEAGSFAKVCRQSSIAKATLSRKIGQLEHFYKAQLLVRSTRNLQLTEVGREIYSKAHTMLALMDETKSVISKRQEKPQGLLRITAGVEYGVSVISPIVNRYLVKYPDVNVELDLTGRRVDLIYEGFDLGVRIGPMEDSTLSARKIGSFRYGLFVGPGLLKEKKAISTEKLKSLPVMGFTRTNNKKTWSLIHAGEELTINVSPRLQSNNYWTLLNAARANLGVVFMPVFLAEDDVRRKSLVRVLPNWSSEDIPVHFIYPSQKYLTSKVRSFIDFAVSQLGDESRRR